MNFPVFASDPRKDTVKPSPYPPELHSYLLRLVEKGESPENQACLATKASLLRRRKRNLSLIARVSQQTPLTHLSLYKNFSNIEVVGKHPALDPELLLQQSTELRKSG